MVKRLFRTITAIAIVLMAAAIVHTQAKPETNAPARKSGSTSPIYQTDPATCRSNLAEPRSILLIGDSITSRWFATITAQLATAGRPACINAQSGRVTAQGVAALAAYKKAGMVTSHTTVVMAVGSNDVPDAQDGYMGWQVDNVVRILGTAQPVGWVDVLNSRVSQGHAAEPGYTAGALVVNRQLWQKDAQYPSVKVAHWNAMVLASSGGGYLLDGLHTSQRGNAARNDLILRTVR